MRFLLATALVVSLAACGDAGADAPYELPVGDLELDRAAPAWSNGDEIHVGDEVIAVDPSPAEWVVGAHGIVYRAGANLYVADDERVRKVATIGGRATCTSRRTAS